MGVEGDRVTMPIYRIYVIIHPVAQDITPGSAPGWDSTCDTLPRAHTSYSTKKCKHQHQSPVSLALPVTGTLRYLANNGVFLEKQVAACLTCCLASLETHTLSQRPLAQDRITKDSYTGIGIATVVIMIMIAVDAQSIILLVTVGGRR